MATFGETLLASAALLSGVALLVAFSSEGATGPRRVYRATWDSLTAHEVPKWLLDAKFGIYAHWGVYSVPAFGNEWYAKRMYDKQDKMRVHQFHTKKYGDPSKFGYKELIPLFRAEKFDPDGWADLIESSGARYAGIAVVHHDGFGLWDSDVYRWNAGKMGPKRDLYGELAGSLRRKNLKIVAAFHHIRTFNWFLPRDPAALAEGKKAGWDLFDPRYADFYWNEHTGKFEDFIAQWRAKVREVVEKYRPDVLWFDGGKFQEEGSEGIVLSILSHYYNKGEEWGKAVEVLNKLPTSMKFNFPRNFGVLTFEEGRDRPAVVGRPWIDDMKISTRSWGYVEGQTYRPAGEIIDGLVDRVSRGGGLLLSLSPKADGTIPQAQQDVLAGVGKWLKVNGEAIHGTRPWKVHAEGPEEKLRSKGRRHSSWVFTNCDAGDIRFTAKGNVLYAIALGWPDAARVTAPDSTSGAPMRREGPTGGKLTIRALGTRTRISTGGIRSVSLLGSRQKITWERDARGLSLDLRVAKPNDIAYVFKIEVKGGLDTGPEHGGTSAPGEDA